MLLWAELMITFEHWMLESSNSLLCPFQSTIFSAGCNRSCGKVLNLRRYFQQKWEVKWLKGYYCLKPTSKTHSEKEMSSREITQPELWKQELNFYTWLLFLLNCKPRNLPGAEHKTVLRQTTVSFIVMVASQACSKQEMCTKCHLITVTKGY